MLFARQISSGALVNRWDKADMGSEEGLVCRDVLLRHYPSSWCEHEHLLLHLLCMMHLLFPAPSVAGVISLMCNIVRFAKCIVSESPSLAEVS